MSRFTEALIVSPLSDGNTWVVLKSFGYDVGEEGSGDTVEVEKGFVTDFASIPRLFWILLPRWGKYGNAAVIHDWLYWSQDRTRAGADQIMFEAMDVLSVPAWQKYLIYGFVRVFGFISWHRNHWERLEGFERVLRRSQIKSIEELDRPGILSSAWRHYTRRSKESIP